MAARLNPYLNFNGTTREAMSFYQQVLGGDLAISTFGEFGQEGEGSDGVMHAQLEKPDGFTIMASDTAPGMGEVAAGSNFAVSLSGDDDALRGYWKGLAEGSLSSARTGKVAVIATRQIAILDKQFISGTYNGNVQFHDSG